MKSIFTCYALIFMYSIAQAQNTPEIKFTCEEVVEIFEIKTKVINELNAFEVGEEVLIRIGADCLGKGDDLVFTYTKQADSTNKPNKSTFWGVEIASNMDTGTTYSQGKDLSESVKSRSEARTRGVNVPKD